MAAILEGVLVAVVLAAVLTSLAFKVSRPRRASVIALALAASATLAWAAMSARVLPLAEEEVTYRPIAVAEDGYVSSEKCRSCHPQEYASWHGSYHRTMTQVASPSSVVGDFDGVVLELRGTTYRLERDGELAWIEIATPGGPRGEGRTVRRPIVLTTGSHHLQAYWYPTGERRNLGMLPFVYLIADERWIPRESIFVRPPPDLRTEVLPSSRKGWPDDQRWNHTCIHCHTTRGQPEFSELDSRAAELGIACEACHGPSAEHVRRNQDPRRRYGLHLGGGADDTVVQPQRLAHERSSQVCGVCHGVSYPRGEDELHDELSTGRNYRPGDDLHETRLVVQPSRGIEPLRGYPEHDPRVREQAFWTDGMVRVKGREYNGLIDSPCFQRGELSCFSCHSMHQAEDDARPSAAWADDQLAANMDGDHACVQCHETFATAGAVAQHSRHPAESSGSRCYNCHMPFTTYGLLKAIRSHQVDSPSVRASLETGRPNACNQCHLDRTLAWSAEHLERDYDIEPPVMNEVERRVPASLIWLLSGDASQRALMAWSMGWESARQASGTYWMTPFLAQLLVDPYDAVRFNAAQSLRMQIGFEGFEYDFLATADERLAALERARSAWRGLTPPRGQVADAVSLIDDPEGVLPPNVLSQLLKRRNDRPVALAE